jgi:predicted ATPase
VTAEALESGRFELVRKLGSGGMGVVYEALDHETNAHVAIKTLRSFDADLLFRLKHEFRELADIQHPNLLRFGELYCERGQWYFTMELVRGKDFFSYVRLPAPVDEHDDGPTIQVTTTTTTTGATTSASESYMHLGRAISPERGYDEARLRAAARQLATAIHVLHRAGRVHRDLKPSNVLVRDDGHLVLLDFGLIEKIGPRDASASALYGTPHFVAPEQIEERTVGPEADWYAFGVMLFLALTGTLPFVGIPPVVVEAKRTRPAPSPRQLLPDVPADLDELCCLLLERDPAARPTGEEVLRRLDADGGAAELLMPSTSDAPSAFVGRGAELAQLADAYRRAKRGQRELLIVQGEPGVGKSTLVRRFLETDVAIDPQAVILAGRCYEQESVPFKAFDTMIDSLSLYLASLPEDEATKLLHGGVTFLSSVFPVLKRVRAVERLVPAERAAANPSALRDLAFRELKHLLAAMSERVLLVAFIDDLQWADRDSVALLRALFSPPELTRGLFISTLRTTSQPLAGAGDLLANLSALPARTIELQGLSRDEAQSLWRELWSAGDGAGPAPGNGDPGTLLDEAAGHPLFLSELVRYARSARHDLVPSARLQDVLWARIQKLDQPAHRFLEVAALAGAPVRYQVVAQAAELDVGDCVHLIGALRAAQMIRISRRGNDRLVEPYHDRVREAIMRHLAGEGGVEMRRLKQLHLQLGRRLLENTSDEELPAAVFTIVQHLNAATALMESKAERRRLAELNLLAGQKAKQATAYAAAREYLERGVALLEADPWQEAYTLTRSLHWERMEVTYLARDRERALQLFSALLPRLHTDEERADLYVTKIVLDTGHGHSTDAIASAVEALRSFGESLPSQATQASVLREYAGLRWEQGRRAIADLVNLPDLTNPAKRCAIRLLVSIAPAAFFASTKMLAMVQMRIVRISLRYGVTDASAWGFGGYGTVLGGAFGNYEDAYQFGRLSLKLHERFKSPRLECRIYFLNGTYLTPWMRPFSEAKAQIRHAIASAQRYADTVYEAYSAATLSVVTYCEAEHLVAMQERAEASRVLTTRRRDVDMTAMMSAHARYCQALRGLTDDATRLGNGESDDAVFGATLSTKQTPVAIFYYFFLNAQLAYLHDDLARAQRMLAQAEQHTGAIFSIPTTVELDLWRVLIGARAQAGATAAERLRFGVGARRALARLAKCARLCPQNFGAHHALAAAELARLRRPATGAARLADAVAAARTYGKRKWEALALELLARHQRERGDEEAAAASQRAAADAYRRWGADGRAAELERAADAAA